MTPLDPGAGSARPAQAAPALAQAASRWTLFGGLSCAALSTRGSAHGANEDAFSPLPGAWRLFVVADGVGGGAMPALASRLLVAHLHRALDGSAMDPDTVCLALLGADRAIASRIAERTTAPGAATVSLCAPLNRSGSNWLIAWVGDCRVYRLPPGGGAELLTRDDTFRHLDEMPSPGSSLDDPARMVGNGAVTQPNVRLVHLGVGEALLACSDGVHKHLAAVDYAPPCGGSASLADHCGALVARARAGGSRDDATALIVRRHRFPPRGSGWFGRSFDPHEAPR